MSQTIELVKSKEEEAAVPVATLVGVHVMPRVDVYETADEVVVQCDMPGVKPRDVKVKFDKGDLRLFGRVAERDIPGRWVFQEHGIGDYHRTFSIAQEVDADRISAEGNDGVLTLHLPKKESAKARQIEVKAAGVPKTLEKQS